MRQIYIRVLPLVALLLVANCLWGQTTVMNQVKFAFSSTSEKDIVITKAGTSSTGGDMELSKDNITLTSEAGYYEAAKGLKIYRQGTLSISVPENCSIHSVVLTYATSCVPFEEAVPDGLDAGSKTDTEHKEATYTATETVSSVTLTNAASSMTSVNTMTVNYRSPSPSVSLPFSFDGGKSELNDGMSQSGLGTDYSASPKLKFDTTGDNLVIYYDGPATSVDYKIKGYSFSGGTFDVMESVDGVTYTGVKSYTDVSGSASEESSQLNEASRFVKFVYTTKSNGNVALGAISINSTTYNRSTATGKFGTICVPYGAKVVGAEVYTAALNGNKDGVVLTLVTGDMTAGVPYIYRATDDGQVFTYVGDRVEEPVGGGILSGVFASTMVPVGSYVMQTKEGVQKFYIVGEGKQPTLSEYKAYLSIPATNAKVLGVEFADAETTAVRAIDALVKGDARIYGADGRVRRSLQKGINIVNGVKVMVK